MEFFNVDISPLVITLLGGAALFALLSSLFGLMPMRRVARYGRRLRREEETLENLPDSDLPPVSLIIYANNAGDRLRGLVEELERQNYPEFELIVVNDGSTDMTREIVENLQKEYSNLKYTFVSDTAKNVSHVKVAYTLGIKAADYDVVVTTAADCHPASPDWLRLLCAPFADSEVDLSLGYSYVPREVQKDSARWGRAFDVTTVNAQWLGSALAGHPFRGDQYNLAFRKKLFFDNKGYASSTALKGGHDDVFVNQVASGANSRVVLHPDSFVVRDMDADQVARLYRDDRERRIFMTRYLHTGAFRLQGFNSVCIWLTLACVVGAIAVSAPNFFPVAVCAGIMLLMWGYEICVYRRTAKVLRSIRLWWSVPLFWALRPIVSSHRRRRAFADSSRHFTWSTGMKTSLR